MPYKYLLESDACDSEACKANPDNIMRDEWPRNYVSAIKMSDSKHKQILIPTDMLVLSLLALENIPYILCYPRRSAKDVYLRRFIERGNTADFIDIFIGRWDQSLSALEQDTYGQHIVLDDRQFLSDVLRVSEG